MTELTANVVRTVTGEEIAAYRDVVRTGLAPATGASPLHAFVVASPVIDESVTLIGASTADGSPVGRVHLSQEITVHRPLLAYEPVTVALEVVGARKLGKGVQVGMRTKLLAENGSELAELVTGAMLVGAVTPETFGELPPYPGKGSTAEAQTVTRSIARDTVTRYAHASGDLNPIHLDDVAAKEAGFADGVICHGMSVLGVVVEEVVDRYANGDVEAIRSTGARFSSAVLPDTPLDIVLQQDEDLLAGSSISTGKFVRFSVKSPSGVALKSGWVELA